ncbi:MAG: type II toxin-antitoxin system VapC family toxin [Bacteroidales bacterium]|nr:type II toxin-antitoxin system VapC family toxin [Bacteroidales bacterium]
MNKKFNIYLDTSVPNFLFADDSPEKRDITIDFFENFVRLGLYNSYISPVVIAEIENTSDSKKRTDLLNIIEKYPIELLEYTDNEAIEIQELAEKYIEHEIIPEKKFADALHIAISVIKRMDYLVSWNYKHLANVNREHRVKILNWELGYRVDLRIITPLELVDYGNENIKSAD